MNNLKNFFQDCLELPWKPNPQTNPEHENQVEELLKKYGLDYISQPNGIQNSPDFRIWYGVPSWEKHIDVECKSSKQAKPMYNGGLPKLGVFYVFSSQKYDSTTIYLADDIIADKKRELYSQYLIEQDELLQKFRNLEDWKDVRGFDFYNRAMYTQSGGADKTDYFQHFDRARCEHNVLDIMEKIDGS